MKRSLRTGAFDFRASLASEMEENSTIADIEAGCSWKSDWKRETYHNLVDRTESLEIPTQGKNLHETKFQQNTFIFFLERWSTLMQFSASFSSTCHERSPHHRIESSVSLTIFDKLVSSYRSRVTNKTHCPIAPALRCLAATSAAASAAASARCSCEECRSGRTPSSDADCDGLGVISHRRTNSAANCSHSSATHQ